MYFAYAMTVAEIISGVVAVTVLASDPGPMSYLVVIIPLLLLLMPVNFRYSRVLMLYLFGGVGPLSEKIDSQAGK
jgi:ABC-type transport system involved in cytochrome c biogenesis permease component